MKKHSVKWREIGTHLGFGQDELDKIQHRIDLIMQGTDGWLREMLTAWLDWIPGDQRGSTAYPTLENLKVAVDKAGRAAFARGLSLAADCFEEV